MTGNSFLLSINPSVLSCAVIRAAAVIVTVPVVIVTVAVVSLKAVIVAVVLITVIPVKPPVALAVLDFTVPFYIIPPVSSDLCGKVVAADEHPRTPVA